MTAGSERAAETPRRNPGWQAPDVIPTLCYGDAAAAIEWLERAFGFERHAVHEGDGGTIDHAELRLGSGMIMLGSAREKAEWPSKAPHQLGGATGGTYVIVDDPDAHHERAKAAGAEIVMELTDQPYGSREYAARDLEGHLWSFGTYRPSSP
jgi:uncharacterized glyoxalase superfamily protein PhnB